MCAWTGGNFALAGSDHPEMIQTRLTTPGFNDMVGTPFFLGRDFLPEEGQVGREHVLIMTHRLWMERFGSDHDIIGKPVRLNGERYTVVGVLAAGRPDRLPIVRPTRVQARTDQSRISFYFSHGPPETGSDTTASQRGHGLRYSPHRRGLSKIQQGLGRHCRTLAKRLHQQRHYQESLAADGRRRVHPVDRLCERGQSFTGPWHRTVKRNSRPRCTWCNTLATLRPVSDRECRAVSDWRRFGHKSRLGPAQSDCSDDSTLYAAVRSRLSLEPTCAFLQPCRIHRLWSALRMRSCVANRAATPGAYDTGCPIPLNTPTAI